MAGDPLTPSVVDPVGEVAGYLAALDRALPGTRRARAEIMSEIGDGLFAAADLHRGRGAPAAAAARAAVIEFGPAELVARAFADELATAQSRRLLAALLLTGPLVGVWWLLLLAPHRWPPRPVELMAAIPLLPLIGVMVAVAVAVLVGTGRLAHRLPVLSARGAVRAASGTALACVVFDVLLLGQLVAVAAAATDAHPPALMAAAAAASLARLPWMARARGVCRRNAAVLS